MKVNTWQKAYDKMREIADVAIYLADAYAGGDSDTANKLTEDFEALKEAVKNISNKKMTAKYIKLDDNHFRHIWLKKCDCKHNIKQITVTPDWYQENGTPICPECGSDMVYSYTEIKI